jgi:Calcineurin-like phosphoesterase
MSLAERRLHSFFARAGSRNIEGNAARRAFNGMRNRAALVVPLALLAGCTVQGTLPPEDPALSCKPDPAPSAGTFRFAVFGDVRPAQPNDTAAYPKQIVAGLFQQIAARSPHFVVGTGDYMFAYTSSPDAVDAQLAMLLDAEAAFAGPVYHTLGNHECTGGTASNCPKGNETPNVRAFMAHLVPAGTATPYYRVDVDTGRGIAKLVFVAANAWSAAQADWLEAQLAEPTAYTFVVRHEAPSVTEAMGVAPSEAIIHKHPLTLELLGHWHRYQHLDTKHVVSGNGGAPLSYGHYGFVLIDLLTNGNLAVSEVDQATGDVADTFTICPQ